MPPGYSHALLADALPRFLDVGLDLPASIDSEGAVSPSCFGLARIFPRLEPQCLGLGFRLFQRLEP